jgi:hypothetical protein
MKRTFVASAACAKQENGTVGMYHELIVYSTTDEDVTIEQVKHEMLAQFYARRQTNHGYEGHSITVSIINP